MRITQEYLKERKACYDPVTLETYVFRGRKWVLLYTVLKDKDIKTADKLWLILHSDFIEEKKLHLLACDYAEHIPQTEEALALIQSKRDWVAGKIADEELDKRRAAYCAAYWAADSVANSAADRAADSVAYWAADRAADSVAYWAADSVAYWAAYWAADRAAYWAADRAAGAAELDCQLEQAIKVMKEE